MNRSLLTLEVEGVRLVDWLAALVAGEVPADVHCVECAGVEIDGS